MISIIALHSKISWNCEREISGSSHISHVYPIAIVTYLTSGNLPRRNPSAECIFTARIISCNKQ